MTTGTRVGARGSLAGLLALVLLSGCTTYFPVNRVLEQPAPIADGFAAGSDFFRTSR